VYSLSQSFTAVIEDPRVIGIIKESGGRMYMAEKNWDKALKDFYEAFLSLVECGAGNANHMLKYTVFSAMLANSEIDHLGTLEAKVYATDPMIIAMSDLKKAAAANDIKDLVRVMSDKNVNLLGDPLFRQYKDDLLRNSYLHALVSLCMPYKSVRLAYLASELQVSEQEIRSLLSELILEDRITGQIDQVKGMVELSATE